MYQLLLFKFRRHLCKGSIENDRTVVKFWIFSYFAQITSIVSCFRKYHSKVLKGFSFFEIEESSKIAILALQPLPKMAENCAFSFRS